jgi:KUP system potassium uptake protein
MTIEHTGEAQDADAQAHRGHAKPGFWVLALGSVGVVYGDIGTSPLYALREAVVAAKGDGEISEPIVYGVLSLILWALILIVTLKYVAVLLNADNRGEGGTLALMALAQRAMGSGYVLIPVLGMIGAALFYGDALITPAISVLSAVEGLKIVTPALEPYIIPISAAIIVGLFAVQARGTAAVATWFGPITAVWFAAIAASGIIHLADHPGIFSAFNPAYAVSFLANHGMIGLVALGAVFLAVTGAEALYADLGHFGKRPVQLAWIGLVFPALALNYLGQGAFLLANPQAIENPFYLMVPSWALIPMVGLATAATIIASQAVITGAFSLTRQAIQLGLLPRMEIRFTSDAHSGQIYMPQINWLLLAGVLILVALFQTSGALASAYGIAVTGTMVVTAAMAIIVIWKVWKWPLWAALALMVPLLALDAVFLGANLLKLFEGGYAPVLLGGFLMLLMWTWRRGTRILADKTRGSEVPLAGLVESLEKRPPHQIAGTAVFFTSDPESAPNALLHSLKHYRVLHERNFVLTIKTSDLPRVADGERIVVEKLGEHFTRLIVTFGFMETPNLPRIMAIARKSGRDFDIMTTSFFLSRRNIRSNPREGMPAWQDKLFIALARNADDATHYFRLPANRVIELGTQITV